MTRRYPGKAVALEGRGSSSRMRKPLSGLKILDLTRVQQGPQATGLLRDLGAEVIKVEDPSTGDLGRTAGLVDEHDPFGTLFLVHNRGKRDIAIDLKVPEGRQVIYRLAAGVDVIASNFRPGVMERLGLGYEDLRAINPAIVYAEASGLGSAGPRAQLPIYDLLGQAASGLISVNGAEDSPQPVGAFVADAGGATLFAGAILAGVVARHLSGEGQRVEVSELGTMMFLQAWELTYYMQKGEGPHLRPGTLDTTGSRRPFTGVFATADAHIAIANLGKNPDWKVLSRAFGTGHLADDERFAPAEQRLRNGSTLAQLLKDVFRKRTSEQWMEILVPLGVCCHPVSTYDQVVNDPQAFANGYVVNIDHPDRGPIRTYGCPIKFGGTPVEVDLTCPELGQHTEEILLEFGFTWDEIGALRDRRVIGPF
jgi:crotonobetainyl-CoA:carnitine CoA-transferase CaiB-like acyl-CoA transferase